MGREKRKSKQKLVKPTFFVFCEGETEEAYIAFLRSIYRLPIEIDAKIAGDSITARYISNYKKQKITHPKDKTFLIYDLDTGNLNKFLKIQNTTLIASNPCFELWYLLHCENQIAELSTDDCIKKLLNHIKNYKKGGFDKKLEKKTVDNQDKAIERAEKLKLYQNPSTNVCHFIENLERVKNRK